MKIADAAISALIAAQETRKTQRTYAPQFKREVVAHRLEPRASVSAIALSHGINASVIRRWLPRHGSGTSTSLTTMLPITIRSAVSVVMPKPRIHATLAAARSPIELTLGEKVDRAVAVRLLGCARRDRTARAASEGQTPNDKCEVLPILEELEALPAPLGQVNAMLDDTGYFNQAGQRAALPCTIRGLEKVEGEWSLVTMAWNVKQLHVVRAA